MKELLVDRLDSPIGTIVLVADPAGQLCALDYADYEARMHKLLTRRFENYELVPTTNPFGFRERVQAYLAGDLRSLDNIPVSLGGTLFQQRVWMALRSIRVGTTASYGELAARLGQPTAYRAVGMTNGLNPIAIVLPCHRVVGSNAALTGYAGGLERKRWLLHHEGVRLETSKTPHTTQARLF